MGKVSFNMSMSLDGFVASPNDEVDRLFGWYFSGDTEVPIPGAEMSFKVSRASAELMQGAWRTVGAMVTGRRNFDLAGAWGGNPPMGVHHFVVTHTIPQEWVKEGSPFTFVTDGVESAIKLAKEIAGDKDVVISSADIMRQALNAGLLDEINIDLVPILLGEGKRLFGPLGTEPIELEVQHIIEGQGVSHMRYAVVKSGK